MRRLLISICIFLISSACISAQWTRIMNGVYGGEIECLALDSVSGNLFAGMSRGGIYRSDDQGQSWVQLQNKLINTRINELHVHDSILYIGSQGKFFISDDQGESLSERRYVLPTHPEVFLFNSDTIFAGTTSGLCWSIDQGFTWTRIEVDYGDGYFTGFPVCCISTYQNTIYAAGGNGFWVSEDGGMNWKRRDDGITHVGTDIESFAVIDTLIFAGTRDGVYMSSVNDISWIPVNNGLSRERIESVFTVDDHIFVGTAYSGVFYSTDLGTSWNPLVNGLSQYMGVKEFVRFGEQIFIATTAGIYRSGDRGNVWTERNHGIVNLPFNCLAGHQGVLYAGGNDGSFYRSQDQGNNWMKMSQGPFSYIETMAFGETAIYVSVHDQSEYKKKLFSSSDQGLSWEEISFTGNGITETIIDIELVRDSIFIATSTGIYISGDGGTNWENTQSGDFFWCIAINGELVVAGSYNTGVYISTDRGNTWTQKNNGIPEDAYNVRSIIISDASIIIGTIQGVFASTDLGSSWSKKSTGISSPQIYCFERHGDFLFAGTSNGLFLSNDQGDSWHLISNGLPSNPLIYKMTIDEQYIYPIVSGVGVIGGDVWRRPTANLGIYVGTEDYVSQVKVYPIPAHSFLFLEGIGDQVQALVFNVQGQLISSSKVLDNKLDVSHLDNGTYILKLFAGEETKMVKFIKQQ